MEPFLNQINAYFNKIPAVQKLCTSVGVKPAFIVVIFIASVVPFLLFGIGGSSLANLAAALIPAYQTFLCLEKLKVEASGGIVGPASSGGPSVPGSTSETTKESSESADLASAAASAMAETLISSINKATGSPQQSTLQDMTFWLQYWVVFAVINFLETFVEWFLFWVPMWHLIKIGGTIWLFHPSSRGASKVYDLLLAPQLRQYRPALDHCFEEAKLKLSATLRSVAEANKSE